jgi:aryl-alcohol dehydrogenase-like predicted oxidoreductase
VRERSLGRSGLRVSEIGFGCWGIGGAHGGALSYGATDDGESRRALSRALELGVRFFDTADLYGAGHSERLLGEALAGERDVVVASKVGFVDGGRAQDFSAVHVLRALDATLARLRRDRLDLYQLHSPDLDALDPAGWKALEQLRESGRVRALGLAARSPADALRALERLALDAVQVNFNLADQRAKTLGLFERCAARGIGVIVRTPLCFGFLTGAYAASDFADDDHRARWSSEQRAAWSSAPAAFAAILARGGAATPAQQALRFVLSHPAVSTAIPGMLTVAHVEENAVAGELPPFPADVLAEVERVYAGQASFVGAPTARP